MIKINRHFRILPRYALIGFGRLAPVGVTLMAIGFTGQHFIQVMHPLHFPASTVTSRLPGTLLIAPVGQGLMHLSQPTHSFSIITAVPIFASEAFTLVKAPDGHCCVHFMHSVQAPVNIGVAVTLQPCVIWAEEIAFSEQMSKHWWHRKHIPLKSSSAIAPGGRISSGLARGKPVTPNKEVVTIAAPAILTKVRRVVRNTRHLAILSI
jgi:hypothetical protein